MGGIRRFIILSYLIEAKLLVGTSSSWNQQRYHWYNTVCVLLCTYVNIKIEQLSWTLPWPCLATADWQDLLGHRQSKSSYILARARNNKHAHSPNARPPPDSSGYCDEVLINAAFNLDWPRQRRGEWPSRPHSATPRLHKPGDLQHRHRHLHPE